MNSLVTSRPRASWHQAGRDVGYLLPGLVIGIPAFVITVTGFFLGLGLFVLAFVGLVVWVATLGAARGFATADRARVSAMEGRVVEPVVRRPVRGSGLGRLFSIIADPMAWREFLYCIIILPVRTVTWSLTITWLVGALAGPTYVLYEWALPRDDDGGGLAWLLGFDGRLPDIALNTAIGLVFLLTLPYVLRALALAESSLVWGLLTNENAELRARADHLDRSRSAVVQAEVETLRRVERDIHDGPQQRLVRLTMDLESAQRRFHDDPTTALPLVEGAVTQTKEALAELRAVSRGIAPPILADRGLPAALAAAAARSPIPTTVDTNLDTGERLPTSIENAAYYVVTEALTNAAKHSGATHCTVTVDRADHTVHVTITDNGRGGAHPGKGHGLTGLTDRLAGVDGNLEITSPPGAGTVVDAQLPLPSARATRH